jgi:hypothetical protein
MEKNKYQHLIPKVYLKAWRYNPTVRKENWKVWGVSKATSDKNSLLLADNFGKDYHYDLDVNLICKYLLKSKHLLLEDLHKVFAPLSNYIAIIDGKAISDYYVFAENFSEYDKWIILDSTSNEIALEEKEQLKEKIENVKIKTVEKSWDTEFENHWDDIVMKIISFINDPNKHPISPHEEFIKKFAVSLEWRGERANDTFEAEFKKIENTVMDMFVDEDKHDVSADLAEMRHLYLLGEYRLFFENKGLLYEEIILLKEKNMDFLLAPSSTSFFTSDRPCFLDQNLGEMILPITPGILTRIVKQNSNPRKYNIIKVSEEEVNKYNSAIINNCVNFYVTSNNFGSS